MAVKKATRDAYGETLVELGQVNPDIVVLDADLSASTKTANFAKAFPQRFVQIGIAEQDLIGTAAGLAAAGKIPFASTFAVFAAGRAYDQIRNSVAYGKLNVKIAATHAGVTVGEDGGSHQMLEDIALMRALPGMTVIVPADAVETKLAVKAAAEHKGPVYLRMGRGAWPVIFDEDHKFEIGKAVQLRDGDAATVIACGIMVGEALKAAEMLEAEGVKVRVLDMATIKPIDAEAVVKAARETGAIVTAEEHNIIGGLGGAVAEIVVENCPVPMERVGVKDVFGQSGKPDELQKFYGLTAEGIVGAVKRVVERKAKG
ncbi:MAG TPA: transketolase family protein [Firmicutes bacterium]|nr:transketolase family protein [Bacillota bacterium]